MPEPRHIPVMLDQVVQLLVPQRGQTLVDGTLGGGGHTRRLAECVGDTGMVIAMDRDPEAIVAAEQNLRGLPIQLVHSSYRDLPEVLQQLDIAGVNGILLDLGLSSDQLAAKQRGFSFDSEGPLDLRFDPEDGEPAWQLLQRLPEKQLADLIYEYGEERYSRRIARRIVERRKKESIRTASQLASLVRTCVPRRRGAGGIDPATRTFQALRIAVNAELEHLRVALRRIPDCLLIGGRVAIISFHSLEDRMVKQAFRDDMRYEAISKKPIRPDEQEVQQNPRSRSAKMRVAQRAL